MSTASRARSLIVASFVDFTIIDVIIVVTDRRIQQPITAAAAAAAATAARGVEYQLFAAGTQVTALHQAPNEVSEYGQRTASLT